MIFSYINFKNFKIEKKNNSKLKAYLKLILKKKMKWFLLWGLTISSVLIKKKFKDIKSFQIID